MRNQAFRRHQARRHMRRRLNEDRNQHYNDLSCLCWSDPKVMASFKEQPKRQCYCCCNVRRRPFAKSGVKLTLQEQRFFADPME
jgi:hypothetical protein